MSEITKEITGKLRLAIKRKMHTLSIEQDDDMLEFIMTMFARKRRFPQLVAELSDLLDDKAPPLASWLDDLIRKVNGLDANDECEAFKAAETKKKLKEEEAQEISSDESDTEKHKLSEDSDSEPEFVSRRSRSRSRSPHQPRVNIFLDDARRLHDISDDVEKLKRQMKKLHSQVSSVKGKSEVKKLKKLLLGMNEQFEQVLEKCDALDLDQKDEQNRKHRKTIIKSVQTLLERNDKVISFLPR